MGKRSDDEPTVLTYLGSFAQLAFLTLAYWLVGSLPEENHSKKGDAWARIGAYRWAAWHFRKYLKYSDDSFGRTSLAWCYANLGMVESAVQHYRLAYAHSKRPDVACGLAHAELAAGNIAIARALVAEIAARRHELSPELVAVFGHLETEIPRGDDDLSAPATDAVSVASAAKSDEQSSSAGRRLLSALLMGSLTFAATIVVIYVPVLLSRASTPAQLFESLVVALIAGVVFGAGLLLVHAPVLGLMRAWLGDRLRRIHVGILGAALVPGPIAIYLAAVRDATPEPAGALGWLALFLRRPGEFLFWLTPFVVGGVVFALAFMRSDGRLPGPPSDTPLQPTSGATHRASSKPSERPLRYPR